MKSASILLIGAASAKWGLGSCPKGIEYMNNLDMEAYSGHWFEVYRDQWNMYTTMADCVTKEFEFNENGNLDLYFRGFYNFHGWGKYSGINGELSQCGTSNSFYGEPYTCQASMGYSSHQHGFKMLATDYDNYDIYYDCHEHHGIFHNTNLAITSRTQEMSEEVQQEVKRVIEEKLPSYNLRDGMYWTKQGEDKCTYYWMDENDGQFPPRSYWY